jgi:hypothetical protein
VKSDLQDFLQTRVLTTQPRFLGEERLTSVKYPKLNLKGLIMGNPVTDWTVDGKASYVLMAHYYGLFGADMLKKINDNKCTFSYTNVDPTITNTKECLQIYEEFKQLTQCINVYDIYRKPLKCSGEKKMPRAFGETQVGGVNKTYSRYFTSQQYSPWLSSDHPVTVLEAAHADWLNR